MCVHTNTVCPHKKKRSFIPLNPSALCFTPLPVGTQGRTDLLFSPAETCSLAAARVTSFPPAPPTPGDSDGDYNQDTENYTHSRQAQWCKERCIILACANGLRHRYMSTFTHPRSHSAGKEMYEQDAMRRPHTHTHTHSQTHTHCLTNSGAVLLLSN